MPDTLFQRLQQYASQHELRIAEKLGSGIHGLVHATIREESQERSALKAHHVLETYLCEREAYQRLQTASVNQIQSLNVPQLLSWDDELLVIDMTIVTKPFLLDFAGATVGHRADFPDEVWREWEEEKREQFGDHWPFVQKVIAELEGFGIYLNDVSPSNIAWE